MQKLPRRLLAGPDALGRRAHDDVLRVSDLWEPVEVLVEGVLRVRWGGCSEIGELGISDGWAAVGAMFLRVCGRERDGGVEYGVHGVRGYELDVLRHSMAREVVWK